MKKLLTYLILLLGLNTFGQVSINTTNPQGTLHVESVNDTGLVLPRVSSVENVSNGNNTAPLEGTTVYDLSRNSTCFYQNSKWVCIQRDSSGNPILEDVVIPVYNATSTNDYIKPLFANVNRAFGYSVAISSDGLTLIVGCRGDASNAVGINGNEFGGGVTASGATYIFTKTSGNWTQEAYIKTSNAQNNDQFGYNVTVSSDGNTMAASAVLEASGATGINGDQTSNTESSSGAVYVFSRSGTTWTQEAYIKPSNTSSGARFGESLDLSSNGNALIVGSINEDSNATGINGDQTNSLATDSGAAYLFSRTWTQDTYIKASNTNASDSFGYCVKISENGNTIAVSANREDSSSSGINGNQTDNSVFSSGALYVYTKTGSNWTQEAYIKSSNPGVVDDFGYDFDLSANGTTLVVGARTERSNATGVNGNQTDDSTFGTGAAYIFEKPSSTWSQTAYLKASNSEADDYFGQDVSISDNGDLVFISAISEESNATGVNGDQTDNSLNDSGATYVFKKQFGSWQQQAYIKASNTNSRDNYGISTAVSGNGNTLVVGADREASNATGLNGNQTNNSLIACGAVYVYYPD